MSEIASSLSTLALTRLHGSFTEITAYKVVHSGITLAQIDAALAELVIARDWVKTLEGWRMRRAYRRWLNFYADRLNDARRVALLIPKYPHPPKKWGA